MVSSSLCTGCRPPAGSITAKRRMASPTGPLTYIPLRQALHRDCCRSLFAKRVVPVMVVPVMVVPVMVVPVMVVPVMGEARVRFPEAELLGGERQQVRGVEQQISAPQPARVQRQSPH